MLRVRPRDHHDRTHQNLVAITAFIVILLVASAQDAASNTIEAISWGHDPSGDTTITIVCTEAIDASSFRTYPIADPPRAVVVLEGITKPVKPAVLTIGDRHIVQLRLGYFEDRSPPELHVILDLASESAQVLELRHDQTQLVAVIGSSQKPTTTPPMLPSPTPLPRPTRIPPSPTTTMSPTSSSVFPDRPAPPALPPTPSPTVAAPTSVPTATATIPQTPMTFPSPTPALEPVIANRVVDLAAGLRDDGSTLLRITANGRLPYGCARYLEIADEPPRIILTIRAISAPDLPRVLEIGDPNLDRIRLIHDAETSEGELHLVLYLTRAEISVVELKQVGPHLVVQLAAEDSQPLAP